MYSRNPIIDQLKSPPVWTNRVRVKKGNYNLSFTL